MSLKILDFKPDTDIVREEVLDGLQKPLKHLPSKLLYDEQGSRLFDQITKVKDYYPTRTEAAIMQDSIDDIIERVEKQALLVEYGSGSSEKTRILLDHLPELAAYVPIDISKEHLEHSAKLIAEDYSELEVLPVCADYTKPFYLPSPKNPSSQRFIYYPGSTIGNFHPEEASTFLSQIASMAGTKGSLLLGVDLKKDPETLMAAYNDSEGVTAAFNLNLLVRLNRELNADFNVEHFNHQAVYNEPKGRMEMHLISLKDQKVDIDGIPISLQEGETIWTESSYKYTLEDFKAVSAEAGFEVQKVWTDSDQLFSVQFLTTKNGNGPG